MGDSGAANDFLPVGKPSAVGEGRLWEVVVHVFQEFLGRQASEDQHGVEATKCEDKDTEQYCDKGAGETDPVGFEYSQEDLSSGQILLAGVVTDLVIVDYDIGDAQGGEKDNHQRQVRHEDVEEAVIMSG